MEALARVPIENEKGPNFMEGAFISVAGAATEIKGLESNFLDAYTGLLRPPNSKSNTMYSTVICDIYIYIVYNIIIFCFAVWYLNNFLCHKAVKYENHIPIRMMKSSMKLTS